ncbi:MAG: hypothetical protein IT440_04740 [Phycisphaeraceae bacterium]|nr:hypothetical protein [Phycisphaeraceae bacterium]
MIRLSTCCIVVAVSLGLAGIVVAQEQDGLTPPDFANMDKNTLVTMCKQLWDQVQTQNQRIAQLESSVNNEQACSDKESGDIHGSWIVKITSNPEPDTSTIDAKMRSEESNLATCNTILAQAQRHFNSVLAKGKYDANKNRFGYQSSEFNQATMTLNAAATQAKLAQSKIKLLYAQLEAIKLARTMTGITEDGKSVVIIVRGIYSSIGPMLVVGNTYSLVGSGHTTDSGGTIRVKTADLRSPN